MTDPVITFDPGEHRYTVDSSPILSVTQVLEAANISDWSGVPDDILWAAQQRGTMVHRAAHYINQRNLDPETVDERIVGYVEGWKAFRRDHEFKVGHSVRNGKNVIHSELLVYRRITIDDKEVVRRRESDLEIIGQLDAEGTVKKNGAVMVDVKTGDPTEAWAPQTATYVRAFSPKARYTHKRLVVQLKKDGTYKLHWFPIRDFDRDWGIFRRSLIEIRQQEQEAKVA